MAFVGSNLTWGDINQAAGVDAASRLSHFTQMRYDIVHRGKRPYIRRAQPVKCIHITGSIASTIDADIRDTCLT